MGDKTKIEWTDASSADVATLMAADAERHDLEPVRPGVPFVMVIVGGRLTAIGTPALSDRLEEPEPACSPYRLHRQCRRSLIGRSADAPLSGRHAPAVEACRTEAVVPRSVDGVSLDREPHAARSAVLQPRGDVRLVLLNGHTDALGRRLDAPRCRAHSGIG